MHLLAMRKTEPDGLAALIAKRRVERGIRWLNSVRPYDWWKIFYHPKHGRFRARDEYAEECPLALAFKPEEAMRGGIFWDVTYAQVANHLRLRRPWLMAHGFLAHGNPARKPWVTSKLLNVAWEREVRESPLILRRTFAFPGVPSPSEERRKAWIGRMIQSIRTRRIMRRAGILKSATA